MGSQPECRYCVKPEGHADHCPTLDPNPDWAIGEWNKGYERGYADESIRYYLLPNYSLPFRRGYKKGKDIVDAMVDDAAQSRMW